MAFLVSFFFSLYGGPVKLVLIWFSVNNNGSQSNKPIITAALPWGKRCNNLQQKLQTPTRQSRRISQYIFFFSLNNSFINLRTKYYESQKKMIIPIRCFSCGKVGVKPEIVQVVHDWHAFELGRRGPVGALFAAARRGNSRWVSFNKFQLGFCLSTWPMFWWATLKWCNGPVGLQAILLSPNDNDPCWFDWEITSVSANLSGIGAIILKQLQL